MTGRGREGLSWVKGFEKPLTVDGEPHPKGSVVSFVSEFFLIFPSSCSTDWIGQLVGVFDGYW